MGISALIVIALLETALAVRTCIARPDKKTWRRDRLIVRVSELLTIVLHYFCSSQKWRFIPAAIVLAALSVIAVLVFVMAGNQDSTKKPFGAVVSCIMSVLLCGILLAPAFLFTNYSGLPVSGNHEIKETSAILIDSSRTDPFEEDGSFREVPVHFYYPADAGTEEYPLVVFSHGAFGYYQSNTSTYMELASSGYTVAALDHPHHAFFTQDTSGNMVIVDGTFIDRAMNLDNDMSPEEQYALYTEWMTLRTADMNFAVDEIKTAVQNGTTDDSWFIADQEKEALSAMLEMTDTSKIGLMGHSMGGATSVELGRERSDISAVADIDGTMLGEYQGVENGEFLINEEPYPVPVLEFVNWESYIDVQQYVEQGGRYPNEILIRQADTGFSTTVKDTLHMDFTDLPMFSPYLGKLLGSGERSTEETMKIVNSAVLSFFNCYLKGEGVFTVQDIY